MYCSLISLHSLGVFDGLHVIDQIDHANHRITLRARLSGSSAPCPGCQAESRRVHGHYWRCLGDLPCFGRPVILFVHIRRFRCGNDACSRRTFGERLPEIARPRARHTDRLRSVHHAIALAQSGNPGAHLATRIGMPVGATTLLRRLREVAPEPPLPPRVLGVDDWAWRKGSHYGTILYDLERRRRIDLLPDRKGETLAAWLKDHPGVEIVVRDRAGAYADGARQGAPEATQVADRWHLPRNLGEALRQVADRHRARIQAAVEAAPAAGRAETITVPTSAPAPPPTKLEQGRRDRLAARGARFDQVVALRGRGLTLDGIAAATGLSRSTVKRWLRRGGVPTWRKPRRASILDAHRDRLERRWRDGCRNASALWRELRARGFAGRPGVVSQWAARVRRQEGAGGRGPSPPLLPSGRRITHLLTTEPEGLGPDDRWLAGLTRAAAPELAEAADLAVAFARMVRDKDRDR